MERNFKTLNDEKQNGLIRVKTRRKLINGNTCYVDFRLNRIGDNLTEVFFSSYPTGFLQIVDMGVNIENVQKINGYFEATGKSVDLQMFEVKQIFLSQQKENVIS